jgi:biopolymer transport protein ExbD
MKLKIKLRPMPEINMIPMIDVIFMLLIFFLVATQMKQEEYAAVRLPDSFKALLDAIDKDAPKPVILNVKPVDVQPFQVDKVDMTFEQLVEFLRHYSKTQWKPRGEEALVRIRCDREAKFVQLQDAVRACRDAGVIKIFVAAARTKTSL